MASSIIIHFSYLNQIEAITYSTWVFKIPENDFDQPNGKDISLQWRHNEHDGVLNHQPHECLLNRLFKAQIKENIKAPRHWPLWGEFTGHPWIPRTKGQWRGKCFHLMTSSCFSDKCHRLYLPRPGYGRLHLPAIPALLIRISSLCSLFLNSSAKLRTDFIKLTSRILGTTSGFPEASWILSTALPIFTSFRPATITLAFLLARSKAV